MGSNIMKWIILGFSPILLLELTLPEIQLFKNDDELQKFHESKLLQSWSNVQKRDLETSLVKLNSRLGRSTQFDLIQYDSEESAEVFQVRNLSRSKRSPKKSKEKKSKEKKSKEKKKKKKKKKKSSESKSSSSSEEDSSEEKSTSTTTTTTTTTATTTTPTTTTTTTTPTSTTPTTTTMSTT